MTDRLAHADWSLIPEHMRGAVRRWIENGIPPGSFLSAVICNDLKSAARCADDINAGHLHHYMRFFYNYTPLACWGSPAIFRGWMRAGGLVGLDATDAEPDPIDAEHPIDPETVAARQHGDAESNTGAGRGHLNVRGW